MRRCVAWWCAGTWLLIGLSLLISSPAAAATPAISKVQQLENSLAQAPLPEKTALLIQLSSETETEDMTRSWAYARQARDEATTTRDQIRADTRLAALQRRRGNYADALALATTAAKNAGALPEDRLRAEALLVVANTYTSLADFPASLEIFRELVPLAEATGDIALLARVNTTLGTTYFAADNPALAIKAFDAARIGAEKNGDRRQLASVLNNLGNVAMAMRDLSLARKYHEQALGLRTDTRGFADSHQNLGELALLEGHPQAAIAELEQALALHAKLDLKRNLVNLHVTYADALRQLGRSDEEFQHLQTAQKLSESLGSATITARVQAGFAAYYEKRGDFRAALEAERKRATAADAAVGEKSRQRFDSLQARFDAERRQHEIDVLRRDQAAQATALLRARWQRYGLLTLIALGALSAGAIFSRQRLKRRTEQRLLAETRAARTAAEQADAFKTRLLAIVSHDIRSPLGNVILLADDLRLGHPALTSDPRFQLIAQESHRVLHMAQDLLDATALEAGKIQLQIAPLDLADLVHASLGRLQPTATAKGQTLEFKAPARDEGVINGDAARLAQVVANLVDNAIKYSPRCSTIRVRLNRAADCVYLYVQDEGPGVPAESAAKLFQPFSQLAARPTAGESSHGLGLSIVHEIVRLHRGSIRVESPAGQGAVFIVQLPA